MLHQHLFYYSPANGLILRQAHYSFRLYKLVLIPIILGIVVQKIFKKQAQASVKVLPLVSVIAIVAIVSAVVAGSQAKIAETGLLIFAVVILHNTLGYLVGYLFAKII